MTVEGEKLSVPPSFSKSAEKLGWQTLNFRISPTSIHLVQGNFRLTFVRVQGDEKLWVLDRYSPDGGWHNAHVMRHPGTTRLDWVLKTSHQVISMLSDGANSTEAVKGSTSKGGRKTSARSRSKKS
jgi:hypothetical protein